MAVVVALTELLRLSTASTLHNLLDDIRFAVEEITKSHNSIEVKSASELFTGFVTRKCNDLQLVCFACFRLTFKETEDFSRIKEKLAERGKQFAIRTNKSDKKISQIAMSFIRDDMVGVFSVCLKLSGCINPWLLSTGKFCLAVSDGPRKKVSCYCDRVQACLPHVCFIWLK